MSLTYAQYLTDLANMIVVPASDGNFLTALPNAIDYAEQRLYRDLDLINTITRDSSAALTAGNRNFNLPSANGTFVVVESLNVVTPAGTTDPEAGTRNALVPASREVLNFLWPAVTGSSVPTYFAMVSQSSVIVGPWPAAAYQVEVVGTIRPTPLTVTNTTTLLSVYFPDLFLTASMIFMAGYQKNFGAMADDPKAGATWEQQYQAELASAKVEEARKKFTGPGWSSKEPAPLATPART